MSAPVVQLGAINLNDQANYFVTMEGFDLGQMQTTWDEQVNYSGGANVQTNIIRTALVPVTIPMYIQGSSQSNLLSLISALWVEVDKSSNTLTVDSVAYSVVYNTRPAIIRDSLFWQQNLAQFVLVLMRTP